MSVRRIEPGQPTLFLPFGRAARLIAESWTAGKFRGDEYEDAFQEAKERLREGHELYTGRAHYRVMNGLSLDAQLAERVQSSLQEHVHVGFEPQEERIDRHQ